VGVGDTGALTEVSLAITALGSTEEDSVGTLGGTEGELIKSKALSASGENALAGSGGETGGAYRHLGALKHTDIIGDLADDDSGLAFLLGHELGKTVESHGGGVDLGHVQALGDGGAEVGVRTAGEKLVELDAKTGVGVSGLDGLGRGTVSDATASGFKIDTHDE